jgi:hypothetical protein
VGEVAGESGCDCGCGSGIGCLLAFRMGDEIGCGEEGV